ncbi:MAG: hypothetical protein PHO92_03330, partial [Candidatus Peribacteraceae bacterium]|nr:hypothetical protein [Candidatus Peribacteraceae bacterium]
DSYLNAVLAAEPHGIVLRTYGLGMLPEYLFGWLSKVTAKGIPVVITSQALRGKVDLHRYRKQLTFEKMGIISAANMTYECATVKLMWALAHSRNPRRLRAIMEQSLVGELDE